MAGNVGRRMRSGGLATGVALDDGDGSLGALLNRFGAAAVVHAKGPHRERPSGIHRKGLRLRSILGRSILGWSVLGRVLGRGRLGWERHGEATQLGQLGRGRLGRRRLNPAPTPLPPQCQAASGANVRSGRTYPRAETK